MKTRIITGVVALIVAIPFFIFFHTYMGALMMQVLGVVAVYELTSAVGMKKKIAAAAPFFGGHGREIIPRPALSAGAEPCTRLSARRT